ncbi:MAG: glycosyltransferase family 9 protein, partial [Kiritimatiellae bacterium]|nr:glycosyltransferase family 9 protein [Kiritimatiellia bacterium]
VCIEVVAREDVGDLAMDAGLVRKVLSIHSAHVARCYSPRATPEHTFVAYLRSFDIVLCFLHDPDGVVRQNLLAAGASHLVCHSPIVNSGHAIDHFLAALRVVGINPPPAVCPRLRLPGSYYQRGREILSEIGMGKLLGKVVALHPGSGSPRKNWPLENFVVLAREVQRMLSLQPVFVVGEAEKNLGPTLRAEQMVVLEKPRLRDLAAFFAVCSAYVGNDSGVTHLAAALGLPVVAIFGPTDPAVWGPRGDNVRILRQNAPRDPGPPAVTVPNAFETLRRLWTPAREVKQAASCCIRLDSMDCR